MLCAAGRLWNRGSVPVVRRLSAAAAVWALTLHAGAAPADEGRSVSLTLSPVHLFLPVVEGQVELAVGDSLSLAAIGGFGEVTLEDSTGRDQLSASVTEAGGQVVYYPLERFESLQVGLEVLYVRVEVDDPDARVTGLGRGLAAGPFAGYKLITDGGFTFFVQGGVEYVAVQAESEGEAAESSRWLPLLNVNLGWSF